MSGRKTIEVVVVMAAVAAWGRGAAAQPGTSRPGEGEPGMSRPGAQAEPVDDEPAAGEPGISRPGEGEPAANAPAGEGEPIDDASAAGAGPAVDRLAAPDGLDEGDDGCGDGAGALAASATGGMAGPWSEGVSQAVQGQARAKFCNANALRQRGRLELAAAEYRSAIELWPHPAFYFNLGLVLRAMPGVEALEVYRTFERASAYGPGPIGERQHRKAGEYMARLMRGLARLEVACDVPGAVVYLNGEPLFQGPGRVEKVVEPGLYYVAAAKAGYQDSEKLVGVAAMSEQSVTLRLERVRAAGSAWLRWTAGLAGAGVIGAGLVFHRQAAQTFARHDREFDAACGGGCGAETVASLEPTAASARRWRAAAVASYAVGGAAVVTGVVLWLRGRPARRASPGGQLIGVAAPAATPVATVAPVIGPGHVGLGAAFSF